jgi:hypothetical protein
MASWRRMRPATTATPSVVTDAPAASKSLGTSAILPQLDAALPHARGSRAMRFAETGSLLGPKLVDPSFAIKEIPCRVTDARQLALLSAATPAPVERRLRQMRARQSVATTIRLQARGATTATPSMVMGAAALARGKPGTAALHQTAIDPHATQSAETARGLVRRDATMAPPCRATGARQLAQSSVASIARGAPRSLGTRVHRPAATERRLRMRPATTATPSAVMGAAAPA